MRSNSHEHNAGFSLIETLVASALIASVVVGLAHLVALGAHQSLRSRRAASAVTVVQSKLEELRNLAWRYDQNGAPVSSAGLAMSPAGALGEDTPGYVDFVDPHGEVVPLDGAQLPDLVRRWSIGAFEADPDTLILQVCAFTVRALTARDQMPVGCASAIRTRKP